MKVRKIKFAFLGLMLMGSGFFFMPKQSNAQSLSGTCCGGAGTCIIDGVKVHESWARLDGKPCDASIGFN